MSEPPDICETLPTDKKAVCRNIVEAHARSELSTREAETELSQLAGEEIVMAEPPHGLGYGTSKDSRQDMENWAKELCSTLSQGLESTAKACVRELDNFFTLGKDFDAVIKKIASMSKKSDDDIEKLIVNTCPCMKG